ncbi:MAG: DUF308 domain-containing protein [Gemmatimonadota bacterium]|jgi:uncharacterized membrane protein HdeD (DUF308 family)
MANRTLPDGQTLKWLGIALIVLGVIAIFTPVMAGGTVVVLIGLILIIAGGLQLYRGIKADTFTDKLTTSVLGILTLVAGIFVVMNPLLGLAYLTALLAVFFAVEGIWKVVASFRYRPAKGWIGLAISGVLSVVLAFLIWRQWPLSGVWAVGVLVGVNLVGTGIALMSLASTLKKAAHGVEGIARAADAARHAGGK